MAEMLPGRLFLGSNEIASLVELVADKIVEAAPRPEVMVPVMNGAFLFASDLLRALARRGIDLEIVPLRVKRSANHGTPTILTHYSQLRWQVEGKSILVVDTIHDTGHTARLVLKHLWQHHNIKSCAFACLLARNIGPPLIDDFTSYVGYDLKGATEYYYGYGLDRNGARRGLSSIHAESPSTDIPESLLAGKD